MRAKGRWAFVFVAAIAVVHGGARSARAQVVPGQEVARAAFEQGVDREKHGDYQGALAKFREAGQIKTTAGLRFHEAYCLEKLGKLAAALDAYEAADALARDEGKKDVRKAVVARLEPLRARVPQLSVRLAAAPADAEVKLDGTPVAPPLLQGKAFHVDPGEHTITARAAGYQPFTRKLQVPEGVTTTVDVVLDHARPAAEAPAPAPAPPAPPPAEPTAPEPAPEQDVEPPPAGSTRGPSRALPVATTLGAVAIAGAGAAMFVLAGNAQSDAQTSCLTQTSCDDERSKVRTFDALALGGWIGAAGLGVLSVVLWTSGGSSTTGRGPGVHLVASPARVGLGGSF